MWLVKKRGSQVGKLNHLKMKTVVLHGDQNKEVHMNQPFGLLLQNRFQLVKLDGSRFDELYVA